MKKILRAVLIFNLVNTLLWGCLCPVAVLNKGLRESVPFLVFVSVYALFSTSFVGTFMALASIKEIKELRR